MALFIGGLGFALISATWNIGNNAEYAFLLRGGVLLLILIVGASIKFFAFLGEHFKLHLVKLHKIVEVLFVVAVVLGGMALRMKVIEHFPMAPASDFQTYYTIGDMLARGVLQEEGIGYGHYIAQFPHVIGYPFILSLVFKVFGTSVTNALYFGVLASGISSLLSYGIGKNISGRLGGALALVMTTFWPSQILFANQVASEPIFSCMLLFCIYIATQLLKKDDWENRSMTVYGLLHVFLGMALALTSVVRPMATILLIAILIVMVFSKIKIEEPVINKPLLLRGLAKGWIRGLILLVSFLIASSFVNSKIEKTIESELPGSGVSFGYNLLVGLNTESKGTWNEADAKMFGDAFILNEDAEEAHKVARDIAFTRLEDNPVGILNLTIEKYADLWQDDDYGIMWNLLFMEQQGQLTPEIKTFLEDIRFFNTLYYIFNFVLAGLAGIFLWNKKGHTAQVVVLLFLGTAAAHMFLETQNRYHYHILPIFSILAAFSISHIYRNNCSLKGLAEEEKQLVLTIESELELGLVPGLEPERELQLAFEETRLAREEVAATVDPKAFDMLQAIKEGHIIVTVSEAYQKQALSLEAKVK